MVQRGTQAARELELLGIAGPARDAEAQAPAVQGVRLQQRVRGRHLRFILRPIHGVDEVQRQRAALEFDGFWCRCYHLNVSIR